MFSAFSCFPLPKPAFTLKLMLRFIYKHLHFKKCFFWRAGRMQFTLLPPKVFIWSGFKFWWRFVCLYVCLSHWPNIRNGVVLLAGFVGKRIDDEWFAPALVDKEPLFCLPTKCQWLIYSLRWVVEWPCLWFKVERQWMMDQTLSWCGPPQFTKCPDHACPFHSSDPQTIGLSLG